MHPLVLIQHALHHGVTPQVFTYILEYLRATANKEPYSPLPEDAM
jgi:hypothetical protein